MKNIDKLLENDDVYNSMLHSGLGWNLSMIGLVALGVIHILWSIQQVHNVRFERKDIGRRNE